MKNNIRAMKAKFPKIQRKSNKQAIKIALKGKLTIVEFFRMKMLMES
jgi:hypothetical protein